MGVCCFTDNFVPDPADTQVPSFVLIGPVLYYFADPHLLEGHSWAINLASKWIAVCETWSVPWLIEYSEEEFGVS